MIYEDRSMKTRQNPFHDKFQWHIQTIWETGMPVWVLKKYFPRFLFSFVFQQKNVLK